MFTKFQRKCKRGFTLVEVMVASGLFGVATLALCSIYMFSTRGFAALSNYAELDKINRGAMDTLTKEIRQSKMVTSVTSHSVTIINGDNESVTYNFDSARGELRRLASTGSRVLLSDCSLINFDVYQRNNISNTFDQYPAATNNWATSVKVIRLTWKASRPVPGGPGVSENIQTARVVIRKQH